MSGDATRATKPYVLTPKMKKTEVAKFAIESVLMRTVAAGRFAALR